MKLSEEIKKEIIEENEAFYESQYGSLTKEERKKLGIVYTPGQICIKMIEMYDCDTLDGKTVLDPTCGSGNLLMAVLIASQGKAIIYGNELVEEMVQLARKRIADYCTKKGWPRQWYYHIHRGNALDKRCLTDFSQKAYRKYELENKDLWDSFVEDPKKNK